MEEKPERGFHGRSILLVEDNELNQEVAVAYLEHAGFHVDVAGDGSEAVEILRTAQAGDYDVVLMDIQMPGMDGYTATREIRTLDNPATANIPILATTADAFEEDRKAAIRSGMNGHIAKPLDVDELLEVLGEILPE